MLITKRNDGEQAWAAFEAEALPDYWDRLGWRDPFSSAQFTSRQAAYNERVFRSDAIYTPQLVVDGVRECVGSDRNAARAIVAESMRTPRAPVHVNRGCHSGTRQSPDSRSWRSRTCIQTKERSMKNVMCCGFVAMVV